ncbi:DUF6817 domain-containing protein [Rhizobacter sp. Root1221]|uniref:DUF6817 domain-containing protein n=1 Tax=Rhizobacter sp. Root1221 TaxID=1736433 RepID=UPI0006F294AB|nr:hypothetical protein [Rhizobacter sp. Root1221]KQV99484.1 hypothetical protein ASC87_20665 [Rhizobacter sp. Root1221]
MIETQHLALLEALGTGGKAHSSRTLLHHLKGTHDLLEAWGNPQPVCVAGLFHSVYGTAYFRHQSIATTQRERVRETIGDSAEVLAYLFCAVERDDFFDQAHPSAPTLRLRSDGRRIAIPPTTLTALVEIEVANLIEQTRPSPDGRVTLYDLRNRLFRRRITRQMQHMFQSGNQRMSAACRTAFSDFIESFAPRSPA